MENGENGQAAADAAILEKIRKLLRLAENEGATPEEAALAGERAQALLMRFKLERADVGDLHAQAQRETRDPVGMTRWNGDSLGLGQSVPAWWSVLLNGVCEAGGCKSVLHRYGRGGGWSFTIIGRAVDVQVARELLDHLTAAVLRLTRAYRPQGFNGWALKGRELASARQAFRYGCGSRIAHRLQAAAREREGASADCRALVVVDRAAVSKFMAEKFPRLTSGRRTRLSGGAEHYAAGQRAGDQVGLSAQRKVTGGGPRGLLGGAA